MLRTRQRRAANAARSILGRRECITWGLPRVAWAKLDALNLAHRMRYRTPRVFIPISRPQSVELHAQSAVSDTHLTLS